MAKADYFALRHGFIVVSEIDAIHKYDYPKCSFHLIDYSHRRTLVSQAHLSLENETRFDFQKYIHLSLEEDFKVVVGIRLVPKEKTEWPMIFLLFFSSLEHLFSNTTPFLSCSLQCHCQIYSPVIWFSAVLFLLSNTHGKRASRLCLKSKSDLTNSEKKTRERKNLHAVFFSADWLVYWGLVLFSFFCRMVFLPLAALHPLDCKHSTKLLSPPQDAMFIVISRT